jgi:hypothetical protein
MDAEKVNPADTGEFDVSSLRPDQWLGSKELECPLKLNCKSIGSFRSIG